MEGSLVDHIPSLKSKKRLLSNFKLDKQEKAEVINIQNQVVELINKSNPKYMTILKEAIISDSPKDITIKLNTGAKLIMKSFKKMGIDNILDTDEAKEVLLEGGINLENYNLNKEEDITRFYNDFLSLDDATLQKMNSKSNTTLFKSFETQKGQCALAAVVAIATAVVLVYLGAVVLAAVEVVGVVQAAAFVHAWLEVFSGGGETSAFTSGSETENRLLIKDLVILE